MPRPRPPKSDIEKQHDAERMRRDFATLGYTAKRTEIAAFKAYCEKRGQTVHNTLRAFVQSCIAEDAEIPEAEDKAPEE